MQNFNFSRSKDFSSETFPLQSMLGKGLLHVAPINTLAVEQTSYIPHRHEFYMLLLITQGKGKHFINFQEHVMDKGALFFLHQGHVHQIADYAESGWLVLFNQHLFNRFIDQNRAQEQTGLFDYLNSSCKVILNEAEETKISQLIAILHGETNNTSNIAYYLLSALLLYANQRHAVTAGSISGLADLELIRKLKILIEANYQTENSSRYYAGQLGLSVAKLNLWAMGKLGKTVSELVIVRMLSECDALLGGTVKSIKEIAYELGFSDPGYFARYYRKAKGISPTVFRDQFKLS